MEKKTYLVGGAVRDLLMGREPKDLDYVVVGSTPSDMLDEGFKCVGNDFPVFLHPETGDEYALARIERKSGHGTAGFEFDVSQEVTIEEDLSRRDLTINAIALDLEAGNYTDPYGGISDLNDKVLRHVSDAFKEDPLRVLRAARFLARYHYLGFYIAPETIAIMSEIVKSGEMKYLAKDRFWKEFKGALESRSPAEFIKTLIETGALEEVTPRLAGVITATSLEILNEAKKADLPTESLLAVLLKDLQFRNEVRSVCCGIKAPKNHTEFASIFSEHWKKIFKSNDACGVMVLLKQLDARRKPERFELFCKTAEFCSNQQPELNFDTKMIGNLKKAQENLNSLDLSNVDFSTPEGRYEVQEMKRKVIESAYK